MKRIIQITSYILITTILIAPIILNWDNLKIQFASWKSSFSSQSSTTQSTNTETGKKTSSSNESKSTSGSTDNNTSSSSNSSQNTSGSSNKDTTKDTSTDTSKVTTKEVGNDWARPLPSNCITITSPYGNRTLRGEPNFHKGIDFSCATGTKVYAVDAGKVVRSEKKTTGYGYLVVIEHANGVRTYYAHNSKLLVNVGDIVQKGQNISLSGNTGNSTGPHLHFGILVNGEFINPETKGYLDTSTFTRRY